MAGRKPLRNLGALGPLILSQFCANTGSLKLKYPTGQNAISRQLCETFIPKFFGLYGRDPATILKLLKIF